MNDRQAARELVAAARELSAVKVMTPGTYLEWAEEPLDEVDKWLHQSASHIQNALDATGGRDRDLASLAKQAKRVQQEAGTLRVQIRRTRRGRA